MKYIKILVQILILLIIVAIPIKTADLVVEKKENIFGDSLEIKEPQEQLVIEQLKKEESVIRNNTNVSTGTGWWTYPENIKETTRNGNDLLVLVNKEYKLDRKSVV